MAMRAVAQYSLNGVPIGSVTPSTINGTDVVVKTLGWSATGASPADAQILREAANILSIQNGVNAQALHVYNTFTDLSNFESCTIDWVTAANTLTIGAKALGTGTQRNVNFDAAQYAFLVAGASRVRITSSAILSTTTGTISLGSASNGFTRLYLDYTNTGTVGAVTISKPSGRVNIAAAGTSVVVTNSLCTVNAHVFAQVSTNDTTAYVKNVVAAAGSFTITLGAAATAQTSVDFFIVNAD